MTIAIVLERVGSSRVSEANIPLMARIFQAGKHGEDLLAGERRTDVEGTKAEIRRRLELKLGKLDINWIDKT